MRRRLVSISATTVASYVPMVARSATKVGELEAAVVALDETLYVGACVRELLGRRSQALDSFLEQFEGACQLELIAFELGHNRLEALQVRFKWHAMLCLRLTIGR